MPTKYQDFQPVIEASNLSISGMPRFFSFPPKIKRMKAVRHRRVLTDKRIKTHDYFNYAITQLHNCVIKEWQFSLCDDKPYNCIQKRYNQTSTIRLHKSLIIELYN
jgi:hypothetical protein